MSLVDKKSIQNIEERRLNLLMKLSVEAHPLDIFLQLEYSHAAAFTVSEKAAQSIRNGLANPYRQHNESSALVTFKIAAQTPDAKQVVYEIVSFVFENVGMVDTVFVERERLGRGEIEVHSHTFMTPDYLGNVDVGDLIAAVEGPAWHHPQMKHTSGAVRIFGILSIYRNRIAQLQFYHHDLRDQLTLSNNYGLEKLGNPIRLLDAY